MRLKVRFKLSTRRKPDYIITLLLKGRGIDKKDFQRFLYPPLPQKMTLSDIGVSKMEFSKALKRLQRAYKNKESVVIYTDYDVDGIVAGAILWETMFSLGFKVMPYIPDRKLEGYGFSKLGIERVVKKYTPSLIISVDHGISGEKYISALKRRGIDVVVLDHHLKTAYSPKSAYAVIYTQTVCAGGVSYFFAKELVENWKNKSISSRFEQEYVVLAGIGTITDVMPVVWVSRSLAFYALKYLNRVKNIGLKELLKQSGIFAKQKYSAYDIGFIVGPRINAAGRLGDPLDALRLLCTRDAKRAQELAKILSSHNRERQLKLEKELELAELQLEKQQHNSIYFVYAPEFEEGIVGLLASKLCDKYNRPVLAASVSDGFLKGSARSVKGVNITNILGEAALLLESYGGHPRAAGFSLLKKNLAAFKTKLLSLGNKFIKKELLEKEIVVDIETPLSNINLSLARALEKLEPYGEGNLEPLFLSTEVSFAHARTVGGRSQHVQFLVKDKSVTSPYRAIFFNGQQVLKELDPNEKIKIVYSLGIDTWRGDRLVLKVKNVLRM